MSRHQNDRGLLAYFITQRHLFFLGMFLCAAFLLYQPVHRATTSVTHAPDAVKSESALSTVILPSAIPSAPAPTDIVWRAQDNPHVINGTYTIPAGTTVTMEPGVVVQINQNSLLKIEGVLIGQGTAANHIILGMANYNADISVPGTLDLTYTDISAQLDPGNKGTLLFNNCRWYDTGAFFTTGGYTYTNPPYIQFDHCSFEGPNVSVTITNATVVMRDVAFTGGAYGRFSYVYMYLDNVRSDDSREFGLQFKIDERLFINNVQIRNARLAALDLGGANAGGNFFLGANNVLQGSLYPVQLESAGLLAGTVVPAGGNTNDYVTAGDPGLVDWRGGFTWAPLSVPYVIKAPLNIAGRWVIMPGTTVKFGPDFAGISDETSGLIARGTPSAPILFQRFDPAQPWGGINFRTRGNRIAHVIIEGSSSGVNTTTQNGGMAYVQDMILRDNQLGSHGGVYVIGTRFYDNDVGYEDTGGMSGSRGNLNAGPASPNSFERNGIAARASTNTTIPARNNWWNSPTGPTHPNNPNGTGDPVVNGVDYIPFLTAPPDYSDAPPLVRQHTPAGTYNSGDRFTISWDSSDDHGIVAHHILFSPAGNGPTTFQTVIDNLPGTARSFEWTVPHIGYQSTDPAGYVRVVAVDTAGHERFDDQGIQIPSGEITGNLTFTGNLAGQTFKPGERTTVTWTQSGFNETLFEMYVYLENEQRTVSLGGAFITYGNWTAQMPYTSTDRARILIKIYGSRNRVKYFYGPHFKIRPDARVGDAPPIVALQTPATATSFAAGDTIPISWTASDDEGVRSFDIQISYDGGRGWTKIASDLPGTTRNYNFQTAPGTGFGDARIKIIAFDQRFQQISHGADQSFSLTPTPPPNHSPTVSLTRPTTNSVFLAGTDIIVSADAADIDGTVAQVDFYDGATLVGSDTNAPYQVTWNNSPAGDHTLTAKATDNNGATTTSAAINIIIDAQPEPPTIVPGAQWAALYNGPANVSDEKPLMALDPQGNVYITGQSKGIGTGIDIATIKYDTNGNQLWVSRFNGTGNGSDVPYDLAVDAEGNVYITGTTWRGKNFEGGTEFDYVTIKYDSSGNLLWAKLYSGNNERSFNDFPSALVLDAQGNVYVTGGSLYNGTFNFLVNQVATIKYDSGGNEIWVRTYDSADRQGASGADLKVDSSGNVYIAGTIKANLGNPNNTTPNVLTMKYDSAGTLLWVKQYDDPGPVGSDFDRGERIELDAQGNVYVLGANVNEQSTTNYDVLLLKYTNVGDFVKAQTWDGPIQVNSGNWVADDPGDWVFDDAGNIYITGKSDTQSDYGVVFTIKFDSALDLRWERLYNGPTGIGFDAGFGIALDGADNVFVTGPSINTDNDYDFLVLKYLPDGTKDAENRYEGPAQLDDIPQEIAIDGAGNIYLTGDTRTVGGDLDFLTLKITGIAAPVQMPSLSISDVSLTEGNSGTASATFTVSLTRASRQQVSVTYATANGTAVTPTDYTGKTGTLTFNAGEMSKQLTVFIKGDVSVEPNEDFFVNLTNASNAVIADAQGVCIINNNDQPLSISGQVRVGTAALGGLTVKLGGSKVAATTTDNTGKYTFTGLAPGGNYTVTPSHLHYNFSPSNMRFSNLSADQINKDFAATLKTFTVSGLIKVGTVGLAGVTVKITSPTPAGFTPLTMTTTETGFYSFANLPAGRSYVVRPTMLNYNFTPASRAHSNLSANQVNQNFAATLKTYSISGRLTKSGTTTGLAGVTMTITSPTPDGFEPRTTQTGSTGYYTFAGLPAGRNYTIKPTMTGYTFTPLTRNFTNLSANQAAGPATNFTGTP
jgi:Bacterial Ig domain/Calx-beta domain/Beta-propeller repeat